MTGDKATNSGVVAYRLTPLRPKNFLVHKFAWKVLASIFWDQDGILLIHDLPKGQIIDAVYYSSLLVQLKVILKEKRRGKFTKGVLFLHGNVLAHRALATQKKLSFQCLDHLPYSPDLAPSDYHMFPGLKKTIESSPLFVRRGGHCCHGNLVGRTDFWFFLSCLPNLEQQAKKCIELRGEYFQ